VIQKWASWAESGRCERTHLEHQRESDNTQKWKSGENGEGLGAFITWATSSGHRESRPNHNFKHGWAEFKRLPQLLIPNLQLMHCFYTTTSTSSLVGFVKRHNADIHSSMNLFTPTLGSFIARNWELLSFPDISFPVCTPFQVHYWQQSTPGLDWVWDQHQQELVIPLHVDDTSQHHAEFGASSGSVYSKAASHG